MHQDTISLLRKEIKNLTKLSMCREIAADTRYILHRDGAPIRTAFLESEAKALAVVISINDIRKATTFQSFETAVRVAVITHATVDHPLDVIKQVIDSKTDLLELLELLDGTTTNSANS